MIKERSEIVDIILREFQAIFNKVFDDNEVDEAIRMKIIIDVVCNMISVICAHTENPQKSLKDLYEDMKKQMPWHVERITGMLN